MMRAVLISILLGLCACSREPQKTEPASEPARPAAPAKVDDRSVIAIFGDSIAAGYGLPNGKSFPDDLQNKVDAAGFAYRGVNLGISGDTTEGGVSRIDSATSLHPAIVVVELGGNDGLRGMPLASTRANLDQMIAAF